jgi:tight adherence protein C
LSAAVLLGALAALLGLAALYDAFGARDEGPGEIRGRLRGWIGGSPGSAPLATAARLGLPDRLIRAGVAGRASVASVMAAKLGCAIVGAASSTVAAPAAPGRLSILVVLAMPAAGFLAPDAMLERTARHRMRRLVRALPDSLDLLAVGAATGRNTAAGFAELATGEGPLSRELAMTVAEISCGRPQREALGSLRRRAPAREVAALIAVIERSRRYGSPLADQLRSQASALRGDERRRVEEQAARAAPKIQLAVALLLVPSVLLMIAAALIANADRLLSGI